MLEQRVAGRTRELAALYEVTSVASASLDLETVLERSLHHVLHVMDSRLGAIHLLDEAERQLTLAEWQGVPNEDIPRIARVPVDEELVGWVVDDSQTVVLPEIVSGARPIMDIPAAESRPYVGAPIRAKGRVVGVLSVVGETGRQFEREEISLLNSIADQVGVAVENARLYRQAGRLAVMEERQRLARELHDSVTQALYSINLLAEAGQRLLRAGSLERVEGYMARLGEAAQQALKEMRLMVHELRPPVLEREGLVGALQQRLDAVEGRAGVETRLLVEGGLDLPPDVEEELYRIAQEALNNALKHAAATLVTVRLCADDSRVELEVADNGAGFDPQAVAGRGGLGLVSMRERAERLGGSLTVESAPGEGTRIKVGLRMMSET
jgi:signal transduction histidine kinase